MESIMITSDRLATLNNVLRAKFPTVKSCHMSEAIASLFGFKTNIDLVTALRNSSDFLEITEMWPDRFVLRLRKVAPDASIDAAHTLNLEQLLEAASIPTPMASSRSVGGEESRRRHENGGQREDITKQVSAFVTRVKRKARRLQRSLIRELGEKVLLGECRDWVSTAYGFKGYDDLYNNHHAGRFIFDEYVSEPELRVRLSAQKHSLAFDFDLQDAVARRIVDEVRPTAARSRTSADSNNLGD